MVGEDIGTRNTEAPSIKSGYCELRSYRDQPPSGLGRRVTSGCGSSTAVVQLMYYRGEPFRLVPSVALT